MIGLLVVTVVVLNIFESLAPIISYSHSTANDADGGTLCNSNAVDDSGDLELSYDEYDNSNLILFTFALLMMIMLLLSLLLQDFENEAADGISGQNSS